MPFAVSLLLGEYKNFLVQVQQLHKKLSEVDDIKRGNTISKLSNVNYLLI